MLRLLPACKFWKRNSNNKSIEKIDFSLKSFIIVSITIKIT